MRSKVCPIFCRDIRICNNNICNGQITDLHKVGLTKFVRG